MKIVLLTLGKLKSKPIQELVTMYGKRLTHYVPYEQHILRNEADVYAQVEAGDCFMVCDERGEELKSLELSHVLERHRQQGTKRLVFFIGGPNGHSDRVRQAAHFLFSLSRMTLPHEFAQVVLLEQLYRASTILRGEPYHK